MLKKIKTFTEHPLFNIAILFFIFLNSIIVILQTFPLFQNNSLLIVIDKCFLLIFVIELILRCVADNKNFFYNGWNVFDTIIILFSIIFELSSLRLLRSLRIIRFLSTARLTKTFRVMRFLPKSVNLQKIIISISRALPKIISTGFLLIIVYYIYAILGVSIYNKPGCEHCSEFFGSPITAILTLFQVMTEDSWASGIARVLDSTHPSIWLYFISFIAITTLTILSVITGVIVESITNVSKEFDKGKNYYTQNNHIVILGFNEVALYILEQLNYYEENAGGFFSKRNVLILYDGDIDKAKILVDEKFDNTSYLKVTYMKGNPVLNEDLKRCNIQNAKSVIISSTESSLNIKIILCIKILLEEQRKKQRKEKTNIITAIYDEEAYMELKRAFPSENEKNDNIHILSSQSIISRVLAHTCRKSGFAQVFDELLTPIKNEIHIKKFHSNLDGRNFHTACFSYKKCILLGFVDERGKIHLNPNPNCIMKKEYKGIFLSEKERFISYNLTSKPEIKTSKITTPFDAKRIMFIGCNQYARGILKELDHYVGSNSSVIIYSTQTEFESLLNQTDSELNNIQVHFYSKTSSEIAHIVDTLETNTTDVIVFLTEKNRSVDEADSYLMTHLLSALNNLENRKTPIRLLCEMNKIENQEIAPKGSSSDYLRRLEYVVGNRITCQLITQIALDAEVDDIFKELLDSNGSEFYMREPKLYNLSEKTSVNKIIEAGLQHNEIFIGYKSNNGNIKLNPNRNTTLDLNDISDFILIAED